MVSHFNQIDINFLPNEQNISKIVISKLAEMFNHLKLLNGSTFEVGRRHFIRNCEIIVLHETIINIFQHFFYTFAFGALGCLILNEIFHIELFTIVFSKFGENSFNLNI